MAGYGDVENPTTDIKDFKEGDFVHWLFYDRTPSFAVVVGTRDDRIYLRHFEDGLPFDVSRMPKYKGVRKASKDETLAHFHKISKNFEKEIKAGGLSGALSASKQYYLNGIISQLKKEEYAYDAVTANPADPMTGIYVLMGIYSGQGPSEHLEGLIATPRLSENEISELMIKIKPEGFGNIPSDVYDTPATSHGTLVAYWVYEVPEKAKELVVNPKKLEDLGSEWKLTETFSKESDSDT